MIGDDFLQSDDLLYVRVKLLGRGAFGQAILYRTLPGNSLVVWKEIDLSQLKSDTSRGRVRDEIEILSLLCHANVCGYFRHFVAEDTLYIEMEYANGGSLHQKIAAQRNLFPQEVVLIYVYQLANALNYIHLQNIVHRDVKTMNIFLMKSDLLKLGDFGMAKLLETEGMAESMVGTPYYMSPEVIRGEPYNSKSDVWAMGCVIHEMLTLKRTFEATNSLALAYQIVKGKFSDIDLQQYSPEMMELLSMCLHINPIDRCSAADVLSLETVKSAELRVKELLSSSVNSSNEKMTAKLACNDSDWILDYDAAARDQNWPIKASASSEVYMWGGGKIQPFRMETFTDHRSALQASIGGGHAAVVTIEKELYSWQLSGSGQQASVGQLGHGDSCVYKQPKLVSAFSKLQIASVSCGEDFTVCLTETGSVYSFGSNYFGCLGVGEDVEQSAGPLRIAFFEKRPVSFMSAGSHHVVSVAKTGEAYAWGSNEFGRLGTGTEEQAFLPTQVSLPISCNLRSVCCGFDGTFFLTVSGRLLACGSNEDNRLGLNQNIRGVINNSDVSYDIPYNVVPVLVQSLGHLFVKHISAGVSHSAIIDDVGHLYMFGSNSCGQLGQGNFQVQKGICRVRSLAGSQVSNVACGDRFTVACTTDNLVYAWGFGENGQLGFKLSSSASKRDKFCRSLPRPTFGSVLRVSGLYCRGWTTILIAERILQRTVLKPPLDDQPEQESDAKEEECTVEQLKAKNKDREHSFGSVETTDVDHTSSSTPTWLKKELQEAELLVAEDYTTTASQYVKQLEDRIKQLEIENNELRKQLERKSHCSTQSINLIE